ncbi:MAG: hypothetical protein AB1491_03560 [Thermodesulfobacteriota bacterium]
MFGVTAGVGCGKIDGPRPGPETKTGAQPRQQSHASPVKGPVRVGWFSPLGRRGAVAVFYCHPAG